jgi:acyl transferase domain-containing protein
VVEGHGTGTRLGDPIEAQAVIATYGQGRAEGQPVLLGSVKSNIGHTQAAAGVAAIIKMVTAMAHGIVPATLYADTPSSQVDWAAGAVRLVTEATPWPDSGHPRRAAVSSFGFSGTNAHLILEEPPAPPTRLRGALSPFGSRGPIPWLVSGRTAEALRAQAGRLADWMASHPDLDLADVGLSLAVSRSVFEHRAVVTGTSLEELAAGLGAVAARRAAAGVITGTVPPGTARVAFLFAGQGAQRAGMGAGLHAASPVFAATFDQACMLLEEQLGLPVADVVLGRESDGGTDRADQTVFAQAGLFALEAGLVALLAGCGIRPDAVAGHSVGEIAAAYAAGALSLADACALVAARARLMQALPGGGAMAAIAAGEAEVAAALEGAAGVSVAAVNGPAAVVISGEAEPVDAVAELFAQRGRRVRRLRVSHAFHSHRMDPVLDELGQAAGRLEYATPQMPWASTLTGELVTDCEPAYWVRQAREPVRFADAITTLAGQGISVFLEIGPDGTLSAFGPAALADDDDGDGGAAFVPVLRPGQAPPATVISALGRVHARGVTVDWPALLDGGQLVELPTYAFQRQRFWPAPRPLPEAGGDGGGTAAEARFWAAVDGGDLRVLADTLAVDDQRLAGVVPALAAWRRRELDRSVTEAWRYQVTWVRVPDPAPGSLAGSWLVVAPAGSAGTGLAQQAGHAMAVRGAEVITVEAGPDDGRAELAARIGQALQPLGVRVVRGVVSLLALAEAPTAAAAELPAGLAGTLALVQALGDAGIAAPLWVLTRGAVAAGPGEPASPGQAMTWGLGRVAALEHPDRWGGLIDLPPVLDEQGAARLCAVLAGSGEDQVAIRRAGILGRRLAHTPLPSGGDRWAPSGSVLITGGTGAVGGHVARWVAGRGAPRVVLAGRAGPAAAGVAELAADLAHAGTAVAVTACDIAHRAELPGLLAWTADTGPGISAVMHAAGVVHETAVQDLTATELAAGLAAKAGGAALLDELTAGLGLEAFVLFSSISATWGSGQQAGYAAANAFLDALAGSRQARGLPAASVAWGPWAGGGMASRDGGIQLARHGLALLDPDLAARALGQALDHSDGLVTIADVDWTRFAAAFTLRRPSPLLSSLPDVQHAQAATPGGGETASQWQDQFAGLPRAEQNRMLANLVRAETALVLGHSSPTAIDPARTFRELGFDSLTAIELRDRLTAVTGLKLPATLVFDCPVPLRLAEFLRTQAIDNETDRLPVTAELERIEAILCSADRNDEERSQIATRLKEIARKLHIDTIEDIETSGVLDMATDDEMFDLVETELSSSEFD